MSVRQWNSPAIMLAYLSRSATETLESLRRRWPLALGVVLLGCVVAFAIQLSDEQGRMDLPLAYSVRMTCEEDIEASLWRGGCERVAPDIAKTGRPSFGDLYHAFVTVHHAPSPREASARRFAGEAPEAAFDLNVMLGGQRYGLASVVPEFEGVKSRVHAESVIAGIDERDRALLTIGRAGLGFDALIAGALANLVHPGTLVEGGRQYIAILMGTAKRSDFTATGVSDKR
jgi:hypothetical protein